MPDKFKAIVIDNQSEKFSREIKELDVSFLDQGEVLVKVDYSDLNYKDALILNDGGKLVRDFPRIPGIDFSGKVLESSASEFKKDEARYEAFAKAAKESCPDAEKWIKRLK